MIYRTTGFTLIEVLVSLAITALTLSGGIQAASALTKMSERQTQQWLAQLCAHNELVRLRLTSQMPNFGKSQTSCKQGNHDFLIIIDVSPTPNPSFRRSEVSIKINDNNSNDEIALYMASAVVSRF